MLLEEAGISCEAPLLERLAALARQGGWWNLSGAVYAVGKSGTLTIETVQLPEPLPEAIPLQMGENRLFSGFVLHARLETVSPAENVANIHKKFANACLDYDKIKGEIFLRPRQSGDRMQLSGRGFTSALKKLIQANLPPARRRTAHVLAAADGVIFAEFVRTEKPDGCWCWKFSGNGVNLMQQFPRNDIERTGGNAACRFPFQQNGVNVI